MKVECPKCGAGGRIDEARIPESGVSLRCSRCSERFFFRKEAVEAAATPADMTTPGEPAPKADQQICAGCGGNNGGVPFRTLAGMSVCYRCETFFRYRPFPSWIKVSFAALLVLIVSSLIWNARFIQAYREMGKAGELMARGDYVHSSALLSSAAGHVPEDSYLQVMAVYTEGLFFLSQDKNAQALKNLKYCENKLPASYHVDQLLLRAEMGTAFDSKDYDRLLACAKSLAAKNPDDPFIQASLSSAYACKFAQTGDEDLEKQAIACLRQARAKSKDDASFKDYEQRILHRLQSREVISSDEFKRRFPSGWNPRNTL
ncbi:MAG: zinc-ribbon domain-containing protein [Syntrophobacter sp.]